MIIELFYVEGCHQCIQNRETLMMAAQQAVPDVIWREVNVLEEMEYAVELGILSLPAIVIDKKLAFTRMPSKDQLVKALHQRIRESLPNGN